MGGPDAQIISHCGDTSSMTDRTPGPGLLGLIDMHALSLLFTIPEPDPTSTSACVLVVEPSMIGEEL